MKAIFTTLLFVCSFCISTLHAQTVFAPAGADWYHSHHDGIFHCFNAGDSTILGKSCSIIRQKALVAPDSWASDHPTLYTYNSGDTVFIYNQLFLSFTPLYIFNVNDGDTISIPGFQPIYGSSPFDSVFRFRVDSVRMVLYDTAILKTVFTTTLKDDSIYSGSGVYSTYNGAYAEKIGCVRNGIYPACVGCVIIPEDCGCIGSVRCYSDATLSLKIVSGLCLPPISVGDLSRDTSLGAYPNPADDVINPDFAVE